MPATMRGGSTMRLARIGEPGQEVPAAARDDGSWRDLRHFTQDIDATFLAEGLDDARRALADDALPTLATAESSDRFGSPLADPGKIVCIGLNYRDHAAETGAQPPAEPIVFLKTPDTVVGPDDTV